MMQAARLPLPNLLFVGHKMSQQQPHPFNIKEEEEEEEVSSTTPSSSVVSFRGWRELLWQAACMCQKVRLGCCSIQLRRRSWIGVMGMCAADVIEVEENFISKGANSLSGFN
uniref:Uncharacterized protein n=1 Tax=Grammatophora oceanica TaxID=210454 RepID=A0A7S1Y4X1_9STRA|mmetsp:Transcript_26325/g.38581  ORF Transcript_26325/g.38581 Transcript_26325/m.38581 type:complete len:112 (+) Transcript_26325:141-476(+)